MSDIFVSYAAEDRERVRVLADALIGEGWSVWWDRQLLSGDRWHSVISSELANARRVIVVWTKSSVESDFVLDEARQAQRRNVLDPVLFDDIGLPLGFGGTQTTRLVGWQGDRSNSGYRNLVASLRARLEGVEAPAGVGEPTGPPARARSPGANRALGVVLALVVLAAGALFAWQAVRKHPETAFITVPGGTFLMGSPQSETGRSPLEAQRQTAVESFRLAQNEVTVAEFSRFVEAKNYVTDAEHDGWCTSWNGTQFLKQRGATWRAPGFDQSDDYPVVCVSFNDAKQYINWLSATSGRRFRLPSGAEWEYAARANSQAARPWGPPSSQACEHGNVADRSFTERYPLPVQSASQPAVKTPYRPEEIHRCRDGHAHTSPVARFKPNAFGIHDMMGNVLEWTEDCWGESSVCGRHVVRGGSWAGEVRYVRSANRYSFANGSRSTDVGFRLAQDL